MANLVTNPTQQAQHAQQSAQQAQQAETESDDNVDHGTATCRGFYINNLAKATKDALSAYIESEIKDYKRRGQLGEDPWYSFIQGFLDWDLDTFHRADTSTVRELRDTLYERGVYSAKDRTSFAAHVSTLNQLPTYRPWPATTPKTRKMREAEALENRSPFLTPVTPKSPVSMSPGLPPAPPVPPINPQVTPGIPALNPVRYDGSTASNLVQSYREEGASRELSTLSKMYAEDMKYTGKTDAFDYKFGIFMATCSKAGIPGNALSAAFSFMLKDDALHFYFNNQHFFASMDITSLCSAFKANSEGREHRMNLLSEWNNTNLWNTINANPGKTLTECLDMMISRLRMLQHGLEKNLQVDSFIHNKLVTTCENVPACSDIENASGHPT